MKKLIGYDYAVPTHKNGRLMAVLSPSFQNDEGKQQTCRKDRLHKHWARKILFLDKPLWLF